MPLILGSNAPTGGYEVDNSLRFNISSSDNLTTTLGTPTNGKKFTLSVWTKLTEDPSGNAQEIMTGGTDGSNETFFRYTSNENIQFRHDSSTETNWNLVTDRVFRDPSAWYHLVAQVDTTQGTASDRVKIYINGVQETSFSTENYPAQNEETFLNKSASVSIGKTNYGSNYFGGYMSEFVFIDGTALDPTSFGEFDEDSGIWKPINVSGLTFGNNGFYLPFENSADLGQDDSGNGNDFTVNNLTSIDQTTDTPTNNFATLNALQAGSFGTLSNGNLTWFGNTATNQGNVYPTIYSDGTGKWYWEVKIEANNGVNYPVVGLAGDVGNRAFGILNGGTAANGFYDSSTDVRWNYASTTINSPSGNVTGVTAFGNGDIIMFALDRDNGKFYMGRNGTWLNSGDPTSGASGTGSILNFTSSGTAQSVLLSTYNNSQLSANFGNPPFTISSGNSDANGYGNFEYAVPSGYYALNTKNLAEYG